MTAVFDPISIIKVLAEHEVDCVLLGGLAAVLHGSPATTNDADIIPERSPENLDRLASALRSLGARLRVDDQPGGVEFEPHPALLASMAILNTTTRCGDLDIAFAPAGVDDYAVLKQASTVFDIDGAPIHVAALDDIIRSKESADRPRDRAALPMLYALRDEIARR